MRSIASTIPLLSLALSMLLGFSSAASFAAAPSSTLTPDQAIQKAKSDNPDAFEYRVRTLNESSALVDGLSQIYGKANVSQQIEQLAAVTTNESAAQFKSNTEGKRFEIRGGGDDIAINILPATDMSSATLESGPGLQCPKAWVAAYLYYIGSGAICGAVSLATFMAGFACAGFAWTAGQAVDWTRACN